MVDASLSQHQQYPTDGGSHADITFTLPSSTATGDTCLLWLSWTSLHTNTISGLGAAWTRIQHFDSGTGGSLELWLGAGCTSGNTLISVTNSSDFINAAVQVWANAPDLITSAISAQIVGTTPITPSASTQASGQGVAGFWRHRTQSTAYGSYTDTQGAWVVDDDYYASANAARIHTAHRVAAEAATEQHQGNGSASSQWISAVAVIGTAVVPARPPVLLSPRGFF